MVMDWVRASLQAGTEESKSRSDVLKTLVWPLGLSLAATAAAGVSTGFGGPSWLPVVPGSLSVLFGVLYALGFAYFAVRNPDELRSESYTLRKMAIEKGLLGDSTFGLVPVSENPRLPAVDVQDQTDVEG